MANRDRFLGQTRARVESRARGLARQINRWLLRFARLAAKEEIARLGGDVSKQDDEQEMANELAGILANFGLQQAAEAGQRTIGSAWVVPPTLLDEIVAAKIVRVQLMIDQTRDSIRRSIQNIMNEAAREQPRPGVNEIARRIRRQFHGPDPKSREAVFGPDRAMLIARTELAQTENAAIDRSLKAVGIKRKKWAAFSDGRSGKRRHDKMDGQTIGIDEEFKNPTTGVRLRFPGDPLAPISETANCRCTVIPVD